MSTGQLLEGARRFGSVSALAILAAVVLHVLLVPVAEERARVLLERRVAHSVRDLEPYRLGVPVHSADEASAVFYPVYDGRDRLSAVAAIAKVEGYGGGLELVVACRPDGEIVSAAVVRSGEDRGLGRPVWRPGYLDLFVGRGAEGSLARCLSDLPPAEADRVSGATVTFEAVAGALDHLVATIREAVDRGDVR